MKYRLFIFLILVVLVTPNCYGQRVSKSYIANHPFHAFYFGSTGRFTETTGYRSFFGVISKGTYHETKRKFIISSDPKIMFSDSLTINSEMCSSYQPVDSLIINVRSPYEDLLYAVSAPNVGVPLGYPIDKIYRIYCYDFQIVCADDSISRAFERDFNQSHQQVCGARVSSYKPQEVSIKEIRMKIYWNPDSSDTILKRRYPFANTCVKVDVPLDNVYTINIPQFDYKFLTYKRYDKVTIRKKGKNKIVFMKREFTLEDRR